MSSDLQQRVAAFLEEWHVMSLATADADGAHAANLFYACDGLALVWVSAPDARHSCAIETNPRVAATVAPDYSDFPLIRGVQIEGAARRVTDEDERRSHLALLAARYPFLGQQEGLPPKVREAYAAAAVYRLEPSLIVLIDNTRGFGDREVLRLSSQ
jgi:uncharacterized protein